MTIVKRIDLNDYETKDAPLWYHTQGLMQTTSGYGRRLTTTRMVKYNNRWRRIYCCIFSNIGTCYITSGKDWIVCNNY